MVATDPIEVLTRRVAALETEHFTLVQQLRAVGRSAERTAHSLDDLEEMLAELSDDADEHAQTAAGSAAQPGTRSQAAGTSANDQVVLTTELPVIHSWVEDHIAPMVRKMTTTGEGGGVRWCRQWWEHIDAVERFIALHATFEELSAEESGTWLSVYLRDHLDPHLATLTSPHGPFHGCSPHKHSETIEALGQADLDSTRQPGGQP